MPIRQDRLPTAPTTDLLHAFDRTISQDRWRTYQIASGFDNGLAHRLYLWNAALGQSFHFPLQCAEVALRNVTHRALSVDHSAAWCYERQCLSLLDNYSIAAIEKARHRLRLKHDSDPIAPQIVATLPLGFWVNLLKQRYHDVLWTGHSANAFPHLNENETLSSVRSVASHIRRFRNRVFHHEPLIRHDLTKEYSRILQLLGWICPETRDWMRRHASVPRVIRERPR